MTLDVEYDDFGNAFIKLPDDILAHTGWQEGEKLYWTKQDDDSWSLTNVKQP